MKNGKCALYIMVIIKFETLLYIILCVCLCVSVCVCCIFPWCCFSPISLGLSCCVHHLLCGCASRFPPDDHARIACSGIKVVKQVLYMCVFNMLL